MIEGQEEGLPAVRLVVCLRVSEVSEIRDHHHVREKKTMWCVS